MMASLDDLHSKITQSLSSGGGNPFANVIATNRFGGGTKDKSVILLTGSFGTIAQYDHLQSMLEAEGFRGMAISYPGHRAGALPADVQDYTLADYVQSTVMELLGNYTAEDKLYLIGHSMAGKVIYLILEVFAYLKECGIAVPTIENMVLLAPSPNAASSGDSLAALIKEPCAMLISMFGMINNAWLIRNAKNARRVFFDQRLPLDQVQSQLAKLTFESKQALLDTLGKDYVLEQSRLDGIILQVGVVIIGCPQDHLVSVDTLTQTKRQLAIARKIGLLMVPSDFGHMFILDETAAPAIVEALVKLSH